MGKQVHSIPRVVPVILKTAFPEEEEPQLIRPEALPLRERINTIAPAKGKMTSQ